ncbi:hypothetical protein [Micromonospora sp. NBC_00421]|uniref:hypothetical protein n=1 Tax=Micromonospora sp. NBC_00421 TaxID=2975976 RepID=UPI002E1A7CC0
MADRTFVGLPTVGGQDAACAYSPDIDKPACGQEVTHHVIGRSEGWGWVALNTCADHLPFAVAACAVLDVHTAGGCSGVHHEPAGDGRG